VHASILEKDMSRCNLPAVFLSEIRHFARQETAKKTLSGYTLCSEMTFIISSKIS